MEEKILNIDNDGVMPEGQYESIKVQRDATNNGKVCATSIEIGGNARLTDTIEAASIIINGDLSLTGIIRTESLIVRGDAEILGTVEADEITIDGNTEIKDEVTANKFIAKGNVNLESVLTAKELKIEYLLTGKNTIRAERMEVVGRIDFDGTIEAELFVGKAFHRGYIKSLKADQIEILHPFFLLHPTSLIYRDYFTIEEVECNRMYAESTGMTVVRGADIELAKRCIVEDLEYLNTLTATENCRLLSVEKIEE